MGGWQVAVGIIFCCGTPFQVQGRGWITASPDAIPSGDAVRLSQIGKSLLPPGIAKTTLTPQMEMRQQPEPRKSTTNIQIEHVKGVLPYLGKGYIEKALKCYGHNVERTLEVLL